MTQINILGFIPGKRVYFQRRAINVCHIRKAMM